MSEQERELSQAEQKLFAQFFARLEAAGIPAVLLRNYGDFPRRIGHDLDLFVRRRDLPRAAGIIRELIAAAGGEVLIVHERDYFLDVRFVVDTSITEAIHLDLYHGAFTWHGLPYLLEEELLAGVRNHGGFQVPHPAHEALNIFYTSVLWGGFFKARYQARIAELLVLTENRAEFDRCTRRAFGSEGAPPFDPAARAAPDKKLVQRYATQLRRAFWRRSLRRQPAATVARLVRYWFAELGTMLFPKGLVVAVIGPDAAQNTALLDGLRERIGELFGQSHLRTLEEPRPSGSWTGLLRRWVACWKNWLRQMRKPKAQVHLILSDSSTGDWWCDPARFGFGRLPGWLLQLAARSVPQPDFTFVLTPAGDDSRYVRWAARGPRHREINAGLSQTAMLDCLESILVSYLRDRERPR